MKSAKQTYAEFYFPGSIFTDTRSVKVENRDTQKLKWPAGSYCVVFYEIETIIINKRKFTTDRLNESGYFYKPGAKMMTLKQVQKEMPHEKTLINNMKSNKWGKVVFSKFKDGFGCPQPWNKNDVILKSAQGEPS